MSDISSRSASPVRSDADAGHANGKRKRSLSPRPRDGTRSPSPQRLRSRSPAAAAPRPAPPPEPRIDLPRVYDVDPQRRRERERQLAERAINETLEGPSQALTRKEEFDPAKEFAKLLGTRSGGTYIPPAKMRAMQAEAAKDKTSAEYQRLSWDALRKSLNGLINKVNVANIKHVVPEIFNENLIRGRGLFARAIMRAQASSLTFTPIFASLVAIINTKLPMVGELLLIRLISQFRRAFKRDDKAVCHATSTFIAHLVNQSVAHEIVALEILLLCLSNPTDDSVEIAVGFMREVGAFLAENSPRANNGVYERFRAVLHEGAIAKRVQYMIEVLFQVRKDKYKDNPAIPEGLDLVEEEEQITHRIALDDELQVQEGLNLFKVDPQFLDNEAKYAEIKAEILGGDSDDEDEDGSGSDSDESDDEAEGDGAAPERQGIQDLTETNLINLRRTIYLTIMNSLNFEEAVHKLLKVEIPEGHEIELCNMIVECCSQERSYSTFFGLIGERLCKLNRLWVDCFQEAFEKYYDTIHRYETNKLRNIARFFGHLIASDGISWAVLHVVHMNEEETTSSSRIFVKILMQEVLEEIGVKPMADRFKSPDLKPVLSGMFPMDNPKNTRFSINYFTSIGMGLVTEEMREYLQNAPKLLMAQRQAALAEASSDSDSSSDTDSDSSSDISSSSSDSDSDSDSDSRSDDSRYRRRSRRRSSPSLTPERYRRRSPTPERYRRRSRSRSRSATPDRYAARFRRSPSPRRPADDGRRYANDRERDARDRRGRSRSRSRSPPRRINVGGGGGRRYSDDSRSRSRSRSLSRTPPRRSYGSGRRVSRSPSRSRSRSPPPPATRRRGDDDDDYRRGGGGGARDARGSRRSPSPYSPPRRRRD